jgi:hypothetical protein
MGLDIRLPIGLMFSVFGLILTVYGWLSDPAIYVRSLDININLVWGLSLLAFGGSMLWLGTRRGPFLKKPTAEGTGNQPRR